VHATADGVRACAINSFILNTNLTTNVAGVSSSEVVVATSIRALLVLWMCQLISSPLRRNAAFRSCLCISLSHCLHVCLCVSLLMHITETTCNSAKFSVHVVGLLLLWQLFSKLCTSGLVDKVKFSCNGLWRHDATAAALLLLQCRVHSDTTADAFYWLRTLLNDARR